ncbi:MAG: glycogen synthase, partial [Gammaproteobacteria bacterium]
MSTSTGPAAGTAHHVLMLAAENDALPGGKVGGIGDVIRDAPRALAAAGCHVSVVTPSYGVFASLPGSTHCATLEASFRGAAERVELCEVRPPGTSAGVRHFVLDHPIFAACGAGRIYCDDPRDRPFATDASKFALFCAAAAEALRQGAFERITVVHLHDWHTALVLALVHFHPDYQSLEGLRFVFTIHNLSLQGIRPLRGDRSSLEDWYPELEYDPDVPGDPRWPSCVNPMAMGIRLADKVHIVSPRYAEEILEPSRVEAEGYYGGEGLEGDLRRAHEQGRLVGILNGCEYCDDTVASQRPFESLLETAKAELLRLAGADVTLASAHFIAQVRLAQLQMDSPRMLVTGVSRLTEQKLGLLRAPTADGRVVLESLLDALDDGGLYVLLGTGDGDYERFLTAVTAERENFLFLCGYSDALARALYHSGDLFLMPSSFEPCGIGQMLAMAAGQPCLVHGVGGLADTVRDTETGFVFNGASLAAQADALLATLKRAIK